MKNLLFFVTLCIFTLFAACTSQVEPNLQEPETLNVTIDDESEVTLRSTQAECDDLEMNLTSPPTGVEIAELLECRLNQGVDEDAVQNNCTFSEQILDSTCVDPEDLIANYQPIVDAQHLETINEADTCFRCVSPDPVWECRSAIYTVTFLNDDDCPGAPDEWLFRVVADIYCCD